MKNRFFLYTILLGAVLSVSGVADQTIWDRSPREVGDALNQKIMAVEAPTPEVWSVANREVHCGSRNTSIRIYSPSSATHLPVILLIHGGAWVAGNLDTHDNMARYLCSEAQAIVVSVGYMNAPEGKFPLPLEQCYDTLNWITEHAGEISADAARIAIVGDSAGGNMAAALCLMIRDRAGPKPVLQVLINPAPVLTDGGTLERKNDALDIMRWQALQYLSNASEATHPYASPLLAKDLSGVADALVLLAEKDFLREGGQKYADRLSSAGIPTQVYCQLGVGHLSGEAARASMRGRVSLDVAVEALQRAFAD